jgi:uncharacterized protein (TIGR03663 family)
MKYGVALGLVLVASGALILRLPQLSQRPMHTDESVHAIKFLGLWETGDYRYDPHEYHGPSLYYATLPWVWLSGARTRGEITEGQLRTTSLVFGILLILLLGWTGRAMGAVATWAAAVLIAVSPAMVFYSRYFIHEMMLVVFTFGFLVCGWRMGWASGRGWAVGAGLFLGLMQATKETFVLAVIAAAAALAGVAFWARVRCEPALGWRLRREHGLWGLAAFLAVSITLFTSFFQHWEGPLDAWRTYGPWLKRAEGQSPHVHAWTYYWSALCYTRRGSGPLWTEALVALLGLVGMAASLRAGGRPGGWVGWGRFMTFYTLGLSLIYSLIPYKTPWCVLGFWHGWVVMAGAGVAVLWSWRRHPAWRIGVAVVLAAGVTHLAAQAHRTAFRYADSQRNPHVYAHTLSSVLELMERVDALIEVSPQGAQTVVKVMAEGQDYWPLPWYLRERRAGYYPAVPSTLEEAMADILITSPQFEPRVQAVLGERMTSLGMFGLRPGVFLQLHVESELWARYLNRDRGPAPLGEP